MRERTNTALHPFTPAQSRFMEEHYGLLKWFLSFRWVNQKNACRSSEEVPLFLFGEGGYLRCRPGRVYAGSPAVR